MANFTSIFNKNTDVDANLSSLFNTKSVKSTIKNEKSQISENILKSNTKTQKIDSDSDSDNGTVENKLNSSNKNTEDRTIFIGNLQNDVKKEVKIPIDFSNFLNIQISILFKKDLLKTFKSYGKIESIRFRNVVSSDIFS